MALLARREQSRRELSMKLARAGYERDEVEQALDRLADDRYQDDERFAGVMARSRAGQGYGPARIRAELKSHGLSDARIRAELDALEVDWHAEAAAQLRRRYREPAGDDLAERARRAQFLLRRGFAAATVRAVTHADVDEAACDD
nr:regulatory protein RecX [Oleiagrimonas sp. C23AA]